MNFVKRCILKKLTLFMYVALRSMEVFIVGELVAEISCGPDTFEALYTWDPSLTFSFDRLIVML